MRNTAIDKAEKTHGVKSMHMFDGKLRSVKEIRMLARAAGSTLTTTQLSERLKNRFDTMEKLLRPLAQQSGPHAKPERLQYATVAVKYSTNVAVECAECGHDSPLMFWRIGNHERYRCTRCQTIFEVEMK